MNKAIVYVKKYLVTGLFSIGGIMVLLILVTQVQPMLQNSATRSDVAEKVADSEAEFNTLRQTTGEQTAQKLATVDIALPSDKDATLIYSLVTTVAVKHAVNVESFSIDVGEVLLGSDSGEPYSTLLVTLDVTSPSYVNTQQFVGELYRSIPISEVESLRMVDGSGQLNLTFYYSNPAESIGPLQITDAQEGLIQQMSGWTKP